MSGEQVTTKRVDGIAIITMNRPPANAITYEFACEMTAAFDEAEASGAGAIVLTGVGTFFSGGLDLRAIPSYGLERQRHSELRSHRAAQGADRRGQIGRHDHCQ